MECKQLVFQDGKFITLKDSYAGCGECRYIHQCECEKDLKHNAKYVEKREVKYDLDGGRITKIYQDYSCAVAIDYSDFDGPTMGLGLPNDSELHISYCKAWELAKNSIHKTISEVAVFIALWQTEKEILELLLNDLGVNYDLLMTNVVSLFNAEKKYLTDSQTYNIPWYSKCSEDIELATKLSNQLFLSSPNPISVLWAFIKQQNIVGREFTRIRSVSDFEFRESFIRAVGLHMDRHVEDKESCYLWPFYHKQILHRQ